MNQFDNSQAMPELQEAAEVQTMTQQQVSQPAAHVVVGSIKDVVDHQIMIAYERNLMPLVQPALATIEISDADISRQVALLFTEQGQPIVMGFITAPVVKTSTINPEKTNNSEKTMAFNIVQDGEHCQIQASKSITLKCGESSISMNNKGEIAINGESITSKARKKNNIIGGTINLN
jgi:hypothetical protein